MPPDENRAVSVSGDVSRAVIVTGDHNTVRLTFGDTGVTLPLLRKHLPSPDRRRPPRPGEPPRELDLLDAERAALPFIGRQDSLADLQAWLDADTDLSVYALTGRAGTGKTRLALKLCEANDPAGPHAWQTGFLAPADLRALVDALASRSLDWPSSTNLLIVLDYAAQAAPALARWLDHLVRAQIAPARLRFLLLEREAPEGFGWWQDLVGHAERRDLFHHLRLTSLPDLADLEERRALLVGARDAAAQRRGKPVSSHAVPAAGQNPGFDSQLARSQFGNPRNLVMAGVIAVESGFATALSLHRLDAACRLAARELNRFASLAKSYGIARDSLRHAVAFNTLIGGLATADLPATLRVELEAASLAATDPGALASLLEQELPRRFDQAEEGGPRLATIQPDLIGEAVLVLAFEGEAWREAAALSSVGRAYALDPWRTAASLMRTVQDFAFPLEDAAAPEIDRARARRVMTWLTSLTDITGDVEPLLPIIFSFPEQTLVLREAAARLTDWACTSLRARAEHGDSNARVLMAPLLNNLANMLSDLGQREAALASAQEAVDLRRTLAADRPDAFTPALAKSLWVLGDLLSDGDGEATAVACLAESIGLLLPFALANPEALGRQLIETCQSYLKHCEAHRIEPNPTLLETAMPVLRHLSPPEPPP